jgi:hypothetical protein
MNRAIDGEHNMPRTMTTGATAAGKPGRPEVLTEELARKIVKMIEVLPDMDVEVTWANVIAQVKRKFGHQFGRRVLAMKEWGGRALIAEAYEQAKAVQRQLRAQGRLRRNANMPRHALQLRIETLTAQLKAAQKTIEELRLLQYDKLDILRATNFDLRREVESLEKA